MRGRSHHKLLALDSRPIGHEIAIVPREAGHTLSPLKQVSLRRVGHFYSGINSRQHPDARTERFMSEITELARPSSASRADRVSALVHCWLAACSAVVRSVERLTDLSSSLFLGNERFAHFYLAIACSDFKARLRMYCWPIKHTAILQSKPRGMIGTNNTVTQHFTF